MRAVLVGAVESTRIAAECIAADDRWVLAGIVTLPPALAHRHSDFVDLETVRPAGCEMLRTENANAPATLDAIEALAPDFLFVIGWSQLCGEKMLTIAPRGTVGYHPAPLPRLRGRGVIPWTILLDEPITASTVFMIDAGTDSGPILSQQFFHVAPRETAATLYARHMQALESMLRGLLADLAADVAIRWPQEEVHATYAARRRPEDAAIDWTLPATSVDRLVRACGAPYPGARTALNGAPIVVASAEPVPLRDHRASLPGQIVERSGEAFTVRCGDGGGLRVTGWQWGRDAPPPIHACLGGPARELA